MQGNVLWIKVKVGSKYKLSIQFKEDPETKKPLLIEVNQNSITIGNGTRDDEQTFTFNRDDGSVVNDLATAMFYAAQVANPLKVIYDVDMMYGAPINESGQDFINHCLESLTVLDSLFSPQDLPVFKERLQGLVQHNPDSIFTEPDSRYVVSHGLFCRR